MASRPVRGAWIETVGIDMTVAQPVRRAPCGARGLKHEGYCPVRRYGDVAPRAGRVG